MPFFTVLTPPRDQLSPHEAAVKAEVVRDGFNWTAFALSGFWLLGKRLWLAVRGLRGGLCRLDLAAERAGPAGWRAVRVRSGNPLFIGHEASSLIERKRLRQGWDLADVVEAANLGHAERRFFDRHVTEYQAQPKPAQPLPRAPLPVSDSGIALFAEPRAR